MGLGCGTKCVQYLFFAFNFLFFALGIAVLGVGIYSRIETDNWNDLVTSSAFAQASNLLIASGVIVALLGFLGCCGACKKWNWMLIGYAIFVILIFILEIAAGIYAYTKRDTIVGDLEKGLKNGIKENYGEAGTAATGMTKAIDFFQQEVKCCGSAGPADWKVSKWYTGATVKNDVPESCCINKAAKCNVGVAATNKAKIYQEGCVKAGILFAEDKLYLVGGVGVGIAIVQLFGVIFAFLLCRAYKEEGESA